MPQIIATAMAGVRRICPIGRPVDAPATGAGGLGMSRKANSSGPARFRPITAR